MENKNLTLTQTSTIKEKKKAPKKLKFIGCKECGKTDTTLIKATDSYYCKFCFNKLGKKKFEKKGRK